MDIPWQGVAIIAALTALIAAALYWLDVLPWWGVLIGAPLGAALIIVVLVIVAYSLTDWSH